MGKLSGETVPSTPASDTRLAVSPAEASRMLGIGRTTFYELKASGEIRTIKVRARRLVPLSEIRRLLETARPTT